MTDKVAGADSATPAAEPLALRLNDLLGLEVDAAVIDCWRANYALAKEPHDLHAYWQAGAPAGAVLALRAAVHEIERLRAELARCGKDNCVGRHARGVTSWVTVAARDAAVAAERERWERPAFLWPVVMPDEVARWVTAHPPQVVPRGEMQPVEWPNAGVQAPDTAPKA